MKKLIFLILLTPIFHANAGFPDDLSDVAFTEAGQVKSWPIGATMGNFTITNGFINMPYNESGSWPGISIFGTTVNANAWGIVKENGQWKAGTWEWLRIGQTTKKQSAWQRGHFRFIRDISPKNGDLFGFFVSGTARGGQPTNIARRSNYVVYEWGKGVVFVEGQTPPPPEASTIVPTPAIDLLMQED